MRALLALLLLASVALGQEPKAVPPKHLPAIDKLVAAELPDLLKLYTHLHANPEPSLQQDRSAASASTSAPTWTACR